LLGLLVLLLQLANSAAGAAAADMCNWHCNLCERKQPLLLLLLPLLHRLLLLELLTLAAAAYYESPCFGCMRWGKASQFNCNNLQHSTPTNSAQLSMLRHAPT
jgi:hypothetical protein